MADTDIIHFLANTSKYTTTNTKRLWGFGQQLVYNTKNTHTTHEGNFDEISTFEVFLTNMITNNVLFLFFAY